MSRHGNRDCIGNGTATITATTVDGGKIATAQITVRDVPVSGVSLNITASSLLVGGTMILEATILPGNAANKTVSFTSSAPGIATVTNTVYNAVTGTTSVVVTGVLSGTATIMATTADGNYTAASMISVKPIISVTGVSLNKTADTLQVGDTTLLVATIIPSNATNKTVRFTSSDPSVATVTNAVYDPLTGTTSVVVTGVSKGKATITVTTIDGKKTAVFNVKVKKKEK